MVFRGGVTDTLTPEIQTSMYTCLQEWQMVHTRPQLIHSHMCSRWYTPDIHVHMVTWVAHGTYQVYKYSQLTFKHLSHHTTKACMPAKNNRLNVCSQDMAACFTFASAANRISQVFLDVSKGVDVTGYCCGGDP